MAQNLLASLVTAGVVERAGPRGRAHLRVSPRFMAHAEGTVGRLRIQGHVPDARGVLQAALMTWDGLHVDPWAGAGFLERLLADRDQWGALRPVFPDLGSFHIPLTIPTQ